MEARKKTFLRSGIATILLVSGTNVFALPPTQGQLVIVNGLDNLSSVSGDADSRSNMMVQVYDTHTPTTPCYTVPRLGYNAVAIIKWQAAGAHSISSCAGLGNGTASISKIVITPLNKFVGNKITVVYDATVNTNVPKATASPITFMPPTTIYANMTLIINGSGLPNVVGQTADATHWGFTVTPTTPTFDTTTGDLLSTGVPGAIGAAGIKAKQLMRHYGVIPYETKDNQWIF